MTATNNSEAASPPTQQDLDEINRRAIEELDRGLAVIQELQEKDLRIDINEAYREYKRQTSPLVFEFDGKDYELPRSTPARVNVFIDTYCLSVDQQTLNTKFEVPEDRTNEFLEMVFGPELFAAVRASELEEAFVAQLVRRVLRAWGIGIVPPDGETSVEKKTPDATPES